MKRRIMNLTGEMVDAEVSKEIREERHTEGKETPLAQWQKQKEMEQQQVNNELDDEDIVLTDSGCIYESPNLYECPRFVEAELDGDPETVECATCGRYDWRKKPSIGRRMGREILV